MPLQDQLLCFEHQEIIGWDKENWDTVNKLSQAAEEVHKTNQNQNQQNKANKVAFDWSKKKVPQRVVDYEVEKQVLVFLNSMVEGRSQFDDKVLKFLYNILDIEQMICNLHFHILQEKIYGSDQIRKKLILNYYAFLKVLADNLTEGEKIKTLLDNWIKENKLDIDQFVCKVEILDEQQNLKLLYFSTQIKNIEYYKDPIIQQTKLQLLSEVSRDTPEEKLSQFCDATQRIIFLVERIADLKQNSESGTLLNKFIYLFVVQMMKVQRWALYILALSCNLMFLLFTSTDSQEDNLSDNKRYFVDIVWIIFKVLLLFFSITFFTNQIVLESWLDKEDALYEIEEEKKKHLEKTGEQLKISSIESGLKIFKGVCLTWNFQYKFFICIVSVLGIFYTPFMGLSLVIFLCDHEIMKTVVLSVFLHIDKVVATLLCTIILFYWFTLWAYFSGMYESYAFTSDPQCSTLYECFRWHFDLGWMNVPEYSEYGAHNDSTQILIFNFTYILIINLITTAVISGIIIDTFSDMRGQQEARADDDNNVCFICCDKREIFERAGLKFEEHRTQDHNLDYYIWLWMHLRYLPQDDQNGIETYIYQLIEKNEYIKCLPIKQSNELMKKLNPENVSSRVLG